MSASTTISVYAIAWGGKFIGQGQEGIAKLTVTDPDNQVVAGVADVPITQGTLPPNGDGSGDTPLIMRTATFWGTPVNKSEAYSYTFSFQPPAPIQLTFTVNVYHYGELKATASVQQVVWPGLSLSCDQSVVVVVPGLLTNIVANQSPLVYYYQKPSTIQANVYMMCGCKIDNDFWPGSNFNVQAVITDAQGQMVASIPLSWSGLATFTGTWTPRALGQYSVQVFVVERINGNTACSTPLSATVNPLVDTDHA